MLIKDFMDEGVNKSTDVHKFGVLWDLVNIVFHWMEIIYAESITIASHSLLVENLALRC